MKSRAENDGKCWNVFHLYFIIFWAKLFDIFVTIGTEKTDFCYRKEFLKLICLENVRDYSESFVTLDEKIGNNIFEYNYLSIF